MRRISASIQGSASVTGSPGSRRCTSIGVLMAIVFPAIIRAITRELGRPVISTTAQRPGEDPLVDARLEYDRCQACVGQYARGA